MAGPAEGDKPRDGTGSFGCRVYHAPSDACHQSSLLAVSIWTRRLVRRKQSTIPDKSIMPNSKTLTRGESPYRDPFVTAPDSMRHGHQRRDVVDLASSAPEVQDGCSKPLRRAH